MHIRLYALGQTVELIPGGYASPDAAGVYSIIRLLPHDGREFEYRLKSAGGPQERVAKESQIRKRDAVI